MAPRRFLLKSRLQLAVIVLMASRILLKFLSQNPEVGFETKPRVARSDGLPWESRFKTPIIFERSEASPRASCAEDS
jgi:hypothetical protein